MDWLLVNTGFLEELGESGGLVEVLVKDLENMLIDLEGEGVLTEMEKRSILKDIETAEENRKNYVLYYCF